MNDELTSLLAQIIEGEAAPSDAAKREVACCLAECLKHGDDYSTLNKRFRGRRKPSALSLELAQGVKNGTITPNGMYYCMGQLDVNINNWKEGDLVVRAGRYANHFYKNAPETNPEWVTESEPTPMPVTATVIPTDTYPPQVPVNDAGKYGVKVHPCTPPTWPTGPRWYWQITHVHHLTPTENNGNHNLYCDLLDERGQRIYGGKVLVIYPNGENQIITIDKPPNEPGGNIPLYPHDLVSAAVFTDPPYCDVIADIHTQHPDEGPGNTLGHHSLKVIWQKVQAAGETNIPTEGELRNEIWNRPNDTGVIAYNPTHTFPRYAREHKLGMPLTNTWDWRGQRLQKFAMGGVFAPIDKWEETTHLE